MLKAQRSRLNANDHVSARGPEAQTSRIPFAASVLFYVVVTVFLGRDVLAHLATGIANDAGDPLFTAAILHWNARVLPLSHAWWQFPIFYPTTDAMAFSEHLLGLSVIATPISWLTNDPNVTYNIVALLTFPLCASAMYLLVHRLTGSVAGALVAGLAFGFSPYRISQLPHIQMLAAFWAPLALLGLHAYIESGRRRWLALYGMTWFLQGTANGYSLFFFSVLIGFWVLWFVVSERRWRALVEIAFATVLAVLPLIPILYAYVSVHARHGFERSLDEIQFFSADVAATLCASPNLALWGWLQTACRPEGELFPGTVVVMLAALGFAIIVGWLGDNDLSATPRVVTLLRRVALIVALASAIAVVAVLVVGPWRIELGLLRASSRSIDKPLLIASAAFVVALLASRGVWTAARRSSTLGFYLLAALVTWALALGPTITFMGTPRRFAGPFALMMWLPGVDSLRVPARFWLVTTLCLAVIAGFVVARLLARRGRTSTAVLLGVISIGVLADGWVDRIASVPLSDPPPNVAMLRRQVVLSLPAGDVRDVLPVYQAVIGGWKSVNGYSGYGPSYYQAIQYGVRAERDELFEPFRSEQDLYVLVPIDAPRLQTLVERQPGTVMVARSRTRIQYRLARRPMPPSTPGTKLSIERVDSSCSEAVVSRVIDGDVTSRWYCGTQNGSEVLTADLGTPIDVGGVSHELGRYASEFPRELVIETSVDGSSWQPAWKGSPIARVILGALEHPRSPSITLSFDPRLARYVRLRQTAHDDQFYWSVAELEILGRSR